MSNIYKDKFISLLNGAAPIHYNIRLGQNVKIGANVVIEKNCIIGDNCLIGHNVVMRERTVLGDNCLIGHNTVFEGDIKVNNHVTIHCQCHITSHMRIGEDTFIGPMVATGNTRNIVHGRGMTLSLKGPTIGRGVRVGLGSILTPGITINDNAYIGAGSVVTKDVPEAQMWFGSPAKFIKMVDGKELFLYSN